MLHETSNLNHVKLCMDCSLFCNQHHLELYTRDCKQLDAVFYFISNCLAQTTTYLVKTTHINKKEHYLRLVVKKSC